MSGGVQVGDELVGETRVVGWRRVWARRRTEFTDAAGALVAWVHIDWVLLDARGAPTRVPPEFDACSARPTATFPLARVPLADAASGRRARPASASGRRSSTRWITPTTRSTRTGSTSGSSTPAAPTGWRRRARSRAGCASSTPAPPNATPRSRRRHGATTGAGRAGSRSRGDRSPPRAPRARLVTASTPTLRGDRVVLRPVEADDADRSATDPHRSVGRPLVGSAPGRRRRRRRLAGHRPRHHAMGDRRGRRGRRQHPGRRGGRPGLPARRHRPLPRPGAPGPRPRARRRSGPWRAGCSTSAATTA